MLSFGKGRAGIMAASLTVIGLAICVTTPAGAVVGEAAPPLALAEWLLGEPVDPLTSGGVTVLEFWATWCGPCRGAIPHLSELQDAYRGRGLTIIGISHEPAGVVGDFVDQTGDEIRYHIAVDENDRTWLRYSGAAGVSTIPHAFIVDSSGTVVWHGHPLVGMDEAIAELLGPPDAPEAAPAALQQHADAAQAAAGAGLQGMEAVLPVWIEEYKILARLGSETERAGQTGALILEYGQDQPRMLNHLAWHIVNNPDLGHRDLELAQRLAEAAVAGSGERNASILDTYARILFEQGHVSKAVEIQRKAVGQAASEGEREAFSAALERYLAAEAEAEN